MAENEQYEFLNTSEFQKLLISEDEKGLPEYCQDRKFEEGVTAYATNANFEKNVEGAEEYLKNYWSSTEQAERNKAFVCFFALFTYYRRKSMFEYLDTLFLIYLKKFEDEYKICPHISNNYYLHRYNNDRELLKAIKSSQELATKVINGVDLTKHSGVLHLFSEAVAKYYERNLEEKDTTDAQDTLVLALGCINNAIDLEPAYSKFYATKGRILALLKKYDGAEFCIKEAMSKEMQLKDHSASRMNEFEQHLVTLAILRSYDSTNEKVGELNKLKVDNYKTISFMTAILAFLLGSIGLFSSVTQPLQLAFLLLAYFGLLLVMLSIVIIALSFTLRDLKKKYIIFYIVLFIVGIACFVGSILCFIYKC